ncbi:MAG: hypothetical protein M3Y35_00715 [Actinomycetota bacterium]|nr:hypothetical protein [Actinomycetota bacterium]
MLKKMTIVGAGAAVAGLGMGGAAWAQSADAPAAASVVSASTAGTTTAPSTTSSNAAPSSAAPSTASSTSNPTKAGKGAAAGKHHRGKGHGKGHRKSRDLTKRLAGVSHAQWVGKNARTGAFVTHDAVRGTVSAASATAITIKATDGTSETFTVNGATKVQMKGSARATSGSRTAGAISAVKVGDQVGVVGTGAGPMIATHVVDRGTGHTPKSAAPSSAAPTTS